MEKPLIFFDLETTGVNVSSDRIVQISAIKIINEIEDSRIDMLLNPKIPIPIEATAVHGITDEMVKEKPTFEEVSQELFEFFNGCDLAGFNHINFDTPLLAEEFGRCKFTFPGNDIFFIDAKTIFHKKEQRTLSAALKFYCNEDHTDAHSAISDVLATIKIFNAMKLKYEDLPADRKELNDFCFDGKKMVDFAGKLTYNENGEIVFNFGKNKGLRVIDDVEYARWMWRNDFPSNTKKELEKIFSNLK